MSTGAAASKLTQKYQATIPEPVRRALKLSAGDVIAFEVRKGEVVLRKAGPLDLAFARALQPTLGEWASPEDDEAFREL